jgi:protease-4
MSSSPNTPGQGSTEGSPPQTIVVRERAPASRWFAWLGWAGFLLCFLYALAQTYALQDYFDTTEGLTEKFHSGEKYADDKIAIIRIAGIIAEGDGYAKRQIDRVREDENVKAVVLRVDSPGGTVTGSDYLFHHLTKLREEKKIPLVVSMGSIAASGGYYVSMAVGDQERSIFGEPVGGTGSIGVIIPYYDLTGAMEQLHIENKSIASHPNKQMLSMTRKLTPDQRDILQQYVMETFGRFKDVVKAGRPYFREHPEKLDELATGEVFSAMRAKELKLIDETGFIEDAIARAAELAKLEKDKYRVVEFEAPFSLEGLIGFAGAARHSELSALLDVTTPRAYYLVSTLPALMETRPQYGGEP